MQDGSRLAAVDLGSNSFRLEIGRIEHGQYYRTEYLKETVRQGSGLDAERNLTAAAMQRGWDCVARFGERLASFNRAEVLAVATQTLREARNRDEFLQSAQHLLGFPIDVISGREEARLIYQGVTHGLPRTPERRLVIDIGGRSTELILGQGFVPTLMESYRLGSIVWSTRYFADGKFTERAFETAEIAAKAVLDEALASYQHGVWDRAYGSAGTISAVCDILAAAGWPTGTVDRAGLNWLQAELIKAQSADKIRLTGMRDDRRAIIGGGLSILRALFDLLQIDAMQQALGSLRHGLLYDLMDSTDDQADIHLRSVQRLVAKFGINTAQGLRVSKVAIFLLDQLQAGSATTGCADHERLRRKLDWAAQLHEIGNHISHTDYHKHGAYILDNTDAMGFSLSELHRLSLLVLGHRGKLRKLNANFEDNFFVRQLLCLRLAVILCHARIDPDTDGLSLTCPKADPRHFLLSCKNGWPSAFPQSSHLLQQEVLAWQKTPWALSVSER